MTAKAVHVALQRAVVTADIGTLRARARHGGERLRATEVQFSLVHSVIKQSGTNGAKEITSQSTACSIPECTYVEMRMTFEKLDLNSLNHRFASLRFQV